MSNLSPSISNKGLHRKPWPLHTMLLITLWGFTLLMMIVQWIWHTSGRNLPALVALAAVSYSAVLIWHLSATPPSISALPDLQPLILPRWGWRPMLWLIVGSLLALFALEWAVSPGPSWPILTSGTALIALGIVIAWRHRVTMRLIGWGLAAGIIAGLAAMPIRNNGLLALLMYIITTLPLFIAGGLLLEHTGLGQICLLKGQYKLAARGFLWGAIVAVPLGLLIITFGAAAGDQWVDRWWEPLTAIAPGISEEIWARLFLTTLCYALLRPATNEQPQRALVAAIVIGSVTHGLAHVPTSEVLSLTTPVMALAGLIAAAPMAMLMIKRDLEHAIGYHFFGDFLRFLAAFVSLRL